MTRSRLFIIIAVVIVAALTGALLSRSLRAPAPKLSATTLLEPARELPALELQDTRGAAFDNNGFKGRWSLLFFGFTSCPDVCPTTLALLAQVQKALADLPPAQLPQVVFVSVDPKRDTPQKIEAYVHFFSPEFVGLTGTQTQIDALTKALGVPVLIHPLEDGGYTIDHSAAIFLIDPQGRLHGLSSPPHTVDALTADLRTLVAQRS